MPAFAAKPYSTFSRGAAVAIALREWKAWGSPIDDDAPGTRAPLPGEDKPERQDGLWQRVGEYWFTGQDAGTLESRWTGKHDADGNEFPPERDGDFAWSAAFISYIMRVAGAAGGFPYASNHSTYINIARQMSQGTVTGYVVLAERPSESAALLGDLICVGRADASAITFDDLPAGRFPSHCDIVVGREHDMLSVLGGNVDDAVTMKHVPTNDDGKLAGPDGILDTRYPWFVVLRILYAR